MKVNYYEILGVDRSATEQVIRDKFRQLARESHPDRYKGPDKAEAERKFQTLTEAVNVLTNPARRKQHDAEVGVGGGPKQTTDLTQVAKVYVAKGMKAFQEGNLREAYENLDMAVKHNPNDSKTLFALARVASRNPAWFRQAVQAVEAAVQKEPMNPQYLKEAGLICKKAGLPAKAERYLEQALKWDQDNVEIQSALAELRQGKGETKDSGKGLGLFRKS
jgi:Tfp pilus assembly protein PilF